MRGKKRPQSERIAAVALAEVNGVEAASKQTGIPESTIRPWMERPEFAELRGKTREEMADGFKVLAHLALSRLIERIEKGDVEPRDLSVALGIATDKHLLVSGEATSRTENRSLTDALNDDEKKRLRDWIDNLDTTEAPAASTPG